MTKSADRDGEKCPSRAENRKYASAQRFFFLWRSTGAAAKRHETQKKRGRDETLTAHGEQK
jgi:hypothetical protein